MSKLVVLNLGRGDLQNGIPTVIAQVREVGNPLMQFTGSLPAAPEILDLYRRWQLLYELLYEARYPSQVWRQPRPSDEYTELDDGDVTNISDTEFNHVCQELQNRIDAWLSSDSFRNIDQKLRMRLAVSDEIRVIIETEDNQLRKLPWHLWNFFNDYPHAEVGLSLPNIWSGEQHQNPTGRVRILAILCNSAGINVEEDRRLLESLPYAETVPLVEPNRRELDEQLWDRRGWGVLFFAGHSSSQADGETGRIYINKTDSLTIPQLKNALRHAIKHGLKLVIFNSCDGLGLWRQLADLQIPQMIVMRESVPDKVAQEFLKHFLTAFAAGDSFYLAVREAREKLQGLEDDFHGASWLPVICGNTALEPPTWQELRGMINISPVPLAQHEYELLVKDILQSRLIEDIPGKDLKVKQNACYTGKSGCEYQIGVSAEMKIADVRILIIVDCKNSSELVEVNEVLELASRLEDISAHKGIIVTTRGFQSGALQLAKSKGIALIIACDLKWEICCEAPGRDISLRQNFIRKGLRLLHRATKLDEKRLSVLYAQSAEHRRGQSVYRFGSATNLDVMGGATYAYIFVTNSVINGDIEINQITKRFSLENDQFFVLLREGIFSFIALDSAYAIGLGFAAKAILLKLDFIHFPKPRCPSRGIVKVSDRKIGLGLAAANEISMHLDRTEEIWG